MKGTVSSANLLGFLGHHEDEVEVVRPEGMLVKIVDVNEEEEVFQRLFGAHGFGSFGRILCGRTKAMSY